MLGFDQHLEDLPGDLPPFLDRLVGIGVGTKRNRRHVIAGLAQGGVEQLGRIGLGEQPALEIRARREVMKGVGRPGEAVHAAMFATPIGID